MEVYVGTRKVAMLISPGTRPGCAEGIPFLMALLLITPPEEWPMCTIFFFLYLSVLRSETGLSGCLGRWTLLSVSYCPLELGMLLVGSDAFVSFGLQ